MSTAQAFGSLRQLLHDVLQARSRGESERRLRSAHSFVDGYMRAMLDAGLATRQDLLALVAEERALLAGPATATVQQADEGFDADEGQLPVHTPNDESGVRQKSAAERTGRGARVAAQPALSRGAA